MIYGTLSLCRTSFLHLLKSPLFQQQHHAPLCTGVRGWIEVNTPLESSTQYLLPWPNKWRVSEGASRVDGWGLVIGVWRVGRRVDISVSGGCLASGSRWGGGGAKQLEHMADCQQARDLGLFLLTPSPADLFIYLPFSRFAEGREQAGLECE